MSRQVGAKYRKYSPSKIEAAVKMVETGAMSKKKAALSFGVPRTTLIDKLSGKAKLGVNPGRSTVLTKAEELTLVEYCKVMASIGYPMKKHELLNDVKKILDHDGRSTPFNNNLPGKDWFYGFCKRHPDISQRTAMTLGHQRALINQEMIEGWFCNLKAYLKREVPDWEGMVRDPRRVFNADESGFPLCVNTGKVLAGTGTRHVYQVTSSTKQQLTVMACFNAIGNYIPPLIVFPGERFRDSGIHEFPEAIYGHTQNGWMDTALFVAFLKQFNDFVDNHAIPKPVILFVDGHSTHMSLEAATYCHDHQIVLYCLLANATHVLQPCDVGLFGPMKAAWKKDVKEWHLQNLGQSFTKKQFPSVFRNTWYKVAKLENAVHGFQRCGLFPLCSGNIDVSKLDPSKVHSKTPDVHVTPSCPIAAISASSMSGDPSTPQASITSASPVHNDWVASVLQEKDGQSKPEMLDHPVSSGDAAVVPMTPVTPETKATVLTVGEDSVSESFSLLTVPEIKSKRSGNSIRNKLPKALSGTEAIKLLKEKERKKLEEEEAKKKRKVDRELKKKQREEEKEIKKQEREEKRQKREEIKRAKEQIKVKRSMKRKTDMSSSSSESGGEQPKYVDTDDDFDEYDQCPGCRTEDGYSDEWISCTSCPRKWHISCTGDAVLCEIPFEQIKNYPFVCEFCMDN